MGSAPDATRTRGVRVPRRPRRDILVALALAAAALLSVFALEWDLTALANARERALAWDRLTGFAAAFAHLDLSRETLAQGFKLSLQTLATALWGSALGAALGYVLALAAARTTLLGDE